MSLLIDTFANRLKYAIVIRDIKPIELARKTGISKTNISCYMSGKYEAKQDRVKALANALNVDAVWLMGYDVPMESSLEQSTSFENLEVRAIARDVAKLKPEKKELFKNLLKQMSDEADEASKK